MFVRHSVCVQQFPFQSPLLVCSCLPAGAPAELDQKWLLLQQGLVQDPAAVLPGMQREEELQGQCPGSGVSESLLPEWGLLEGGCIEMLQLGGNATSIGIYSLGKGATPVCCSKKSQQMLEFTSRVGVESSKAYLSGCG